eukprot:SAG31_NODE_15284_length_762_cov_1.473605_2_plen_160_part_01
MAAPVCDVDDAPKAWRTNAGHDAHSVSTLTHRVFNQHVRSHAGCSCCTACLRWRRVAASRGVVAPGWQQGKTIVAVVARAMGHVYVTSADVDAVCVRSTTVTFALPACGGDGQVREAHVGTVGPHVDVWAVQQRDVVHTQVPVTGINITIYKVIIINNNM